MTIIFVLYIRSTLIQFVCMLQFIRLCIVLDLMRIPADDCQLKSQEGKVGFYKGPFQATRLTNIGKITYHLHSCTCVCVCK